MVLHVVTASRDVVVVDDVAWGLSNTLPYQARLHVWLDQAQNIAHILILLHNVLAEH